MIPKICALGLISATLSLILKEFGFKGKGIFSTFCLIILLIMGIEPISRIISTFVGFADKANIGDTANTAVKAIGIGYVFGFTSDICSSLGESSIASTVQTVGKLEIILLALPYFEKTVALGMELLG